MSRFRKIANLNLVIILFACLISGCSGSAKALKQAEALEVSPGSPPEVMPNFEYRLGDFDILEIKVWEGIAKQKRRTDKETQEVDEYLISRADTLNIYVWQWDDLNRDIIVRPDGRISFPLVGDIIAEGLTLVELDEILTERLKEFIRYPEVSVMVKDFGQSKFGTRKVIEELPAQIIVRPDGRISLPLVGEVMARGMTLRELDEKLTQDLNNFVNSPEVYINLAQIGGKKVIVLGEVRTPGVFKPQENARLLDVIALAGGYTKDAALGSVLLVRNSLTNPKVEKINLARIIKGADLRQNIYVQPEDIVYIPKTPISDINYFLQQLLTPLTTSASAVSGIKIIKPGVTSSGGSN